MKESKRVKRAIKTLSTLKTYLQYYMGDHVNFNEVSKDINDLEDLLAELSIDSKKQNARLWQKFKLITKPRSDE